MSFANWLTIWTPKDLHSLFAFLSSQTSYTFQLQYPILLYFSFLQMTFFPINTVGWPDSLSVVSCTSGESMV